MRRTTWISLPLFTALVACSNTPTKGSNSDTNGNNVVNNTIANNGTCGARWCPGECIEDGDGWCVVDSFTAAFHIAMWVASPEEIWLAEQSGNVRVGSGTTWEEHPVPGIENISDIIGTGSAEVFVSTYPSGVYRWDGTAWVEETVVDAPGDTGLDRLAYDATTDTLFVAGQRTIWQRVGERWEPFAEIEGGEMQNVVTCGGTRWFAAQYPVTVDESGFASRWGVLASNRVETASVLDSGEVVAGGDRVIFYDGNFRSLGASFLNRANSLTGTSLTDIWSAVERSTTTEIWHYDGGHWSLIKEYDVLRDVGSVYTDTPGRVRVTCEYGASEVIDLTGAVLSSTGLPSGISNVETVPSHHVSLNEYWLGRSGLYRWTASGGWETSLPGPSTPISLWGRSVDDVWFLTDRHEVYRGNTVDALPVDTGAELSDKLQVIRGTDLGHVWVAGSDQVLEWNGSRWIDHVGFDAGGTPAPDDRVALAAVGNQAWVFRRDDVFWWDGTSWTHVGPQRRVIRVGCESGELVAMATDPPAILRGEPDRMTSYGDMPAMEFSATRAWMTDESDAWVITHELPFLHRWTGDEFVLSLDNPEVQLFDIEVLPSAEAYLMGSTTLFVRRP